MMSRRTICFKEPCLVCILACLRAYNTHPHATGKFGSPFVGGTRQQRAGCHAQLQQQNSADSAATQAHAGGVPAGQDVLAH